MNPIDTLFRKRESPTTDGLLELFWVVPVFIGLLVVNVWVGAVVTVAALAIFLIGMAQHERAQRKRELVRPELAGSRSRTLHLKRG